jgi:hypothetical protein
LIFIGFVAEDKDRLSTWDLHKPQVFPGSGAAVDALQREISQETDLRELP